ncbi:hypothetical protein KKG31_02745 [Patescibacteria group bacterium]|nr:hypothetical protein [Patescibacteria group bacterium]MBU1758079.1 hypothetical protein [Patescibacteria group bacterium]
MKTKIIKIARKIIMTIAIVHIIFILGSFLIPKSTLIPISKFSYGFIEKQSVIQSMESAEIEGSTANYNIFAKELKKGIATEWLIVCYVSFVLTIILIGFEPSKEELYI